LTEKSCYFGASVLDVILLTRVCT